MSADGAVPVAHRLVDGSTEDSTTHVETWDELAAIFGPAFCYVADCKLATRPNMDHIAAAGGRFLTVMPRTRKEDGIGRAWIAQGAVRWSEIARRPGRRTGDPDDIYWAAEAPAPSAEGYRIVWIRSSQKRDLDASSRVERIEGARAGLEELGAKLASRRSKLKSRAAVSEAVAAVVSHFGAGLWVKAEVTETVELEHRQEQKGRPGSNTRYRRIEHHRFSLAVSLDAEAVATDAAYDGCFPFVTNEKLPPPELLKMYKAQPHLERRHATFKGVIEAALLTLKSDARIDALGLCLYVALLVHALVERDLRRATDAAQLASLPLYYEHRPCATPSAARVFEVLEPLAATPCSTPAHCSPSPPRRSTRSSAKSSGSSRCPPPPTGRPPGPP